MLTWKVTLQCYKLLLLALHLRNEVGGMTAYMHCRHLDQEGRWRKSEVQQRKM